MGAPTRVLLAPGYACTSEIWQPALAHLPHIEPTHVAWSAGLDSVDAARDEVERAVAGASPAGYVGHSMGGLLVLELLVARRIPQRPTLIVDAFLSDPADLFKNHVWQDAALRQTVTHMLERESPRFAALRESIAAWRHPGWPETALRTGVHFVYGGRGSTDADVLAALDWPEAQRRDQITIVPRTSHFLMLEAPEVFAGIVDRVMGSDASG